MNGTEKVVEHLKMTQTIINSFSKQLCPGQRLEHDHHSRCDGFNH